MARDGRGNGDYRTEIRRQVHAALLEKIRDDRFPSTTMMDLVEQSLDDQGKAEYADVLLDKVRDDRFPSIDMIRRLYNLA